MRSNLEWIELVKPVIEYVTGHIAENLAGTVFAPKRLCKQFVNCVRAYQNMTFSV